MKNEDEGAGLLPPRQYFAPDQWPSGSPRDGTPVIALHAAELAVCIQEWALRSGQSLSMGIDKLAEASGVPRGTLRHLAAGDRWPRLDTVARVEWALGHSVADIDRVTLRLRYEQAQVDYVLPPSVAPQVAHLSRGAASRRDRGLAGEPPPTLR